MKWITAYSELDSDSLRSANFSAFDDYVLFRHVLMEPGTAGLDALDLVDHLGAFDDFAENAVTPAVGIGHLEVEEIVVGDIDEIVRYVRFDGWQDTHAGEREVKLALRKTLFKYRLHQDQDLFDRAYGYVKEYY